MNPPFFWVENHESFGFFSWIVSRKLFLGLTPSGLCGQSGTSAAVSAVQPFLLGRRFWQPFLKTFCHLWDGFR